MTKEKGHVLFIDNEINILESIKRYLVDEPFDCFFVTDIEKAKKIIADKHIEVVVVDITTNNPALFGFLNDIKESNPEIVKVALSDYTHITKIIGSLKQLDLYTFLLKPWKKDELIETLTSSVDYSHFVRIQLQEKENLKMKNEMYMQIIDFKDSVGDISKLDISKLKQLSVLLLDEAEAVATSGSNMREKMFKNIHNISDMYRNTFPSYIENFNARELEEIFENHKFKLTFDEENMQESYTGNVVLLKSLIHESISYIENTLRIVDFEMNIHFRDIISCDIVINDISKLKTLEHYFNVLKKLFEIEGFKLDYKATKKCINVTYNFRKSINFF